MLKYTFIKFLFIGWVFMAFFLLLVFPFSGVMGFLMVGLLLYVGISVYGSFNIQSQYFYPVIFQGSTLERNIALTFDDGPDPKTTEGILDLLASYRVTASFFCVGKNMEAYPEIVARILRDGHDIGNHTYSHSKYWGFFSTQKITSEIEKVQAVLIRQHNLYPLIFRPPFGVLNPNISQVLSKTKLIVIGWNIRSFDTILDTLKAFERIKKRMAPGGIVLFHDSNPEVVDLLALFLAHVSKSDYQIVSLRKLLNIDIYEKVSHSESDVV